MLKCDRLAQAHYVKELQKYSVTSTFYRQYLNCILSPLHTLSHKVYLNLSTCTLDFHHNTSICLTTVSLITPVHEVLDVRMNPVKQAAELPLDAVEETIWVVVDSVSKRSCFPTFRHKAL